MAYITRAQYRARAEEAVAEREALSNRLALALNEVSAHQYKIADLTAQLAEAQAINEKLDRPMINTNWLSEELDRLRSMLEEKDSQLRTTALSHAIQMGGNAMGEIVIRRAEEFYEFLSRGIAGIPGPIIDGGDADDFPVNKLPNE